MMAQKDRKLPTITDIPVGGAEVRHPAARLGGNAPYFPEIYRDSTRG
jgi:hypothetical protein